jgi:DNA-binding phage protein|tara:strand:+ start:86 stop:514 length:429 start_codon:yes stop_codon:yes gene_type:complete
MGRNIAIIATSVNAESCDYRAFLNAAKSAIFSGMDEIDGAWIKRHLTGARGEQARLAEHLGITTDKLSKTLSGSRNVQPEEIPLLLDFFNQRIVSRSEYDAHLLQQIARLNTAGQEVLRKQLDALLETPALVQPEKSNGTGE